PNDRSMDSVNRSVTFEVDTHQRLAGIDIPPRTGFLVNESWRLRRLELVLQAGNRASLRSNRGLSGCHLLLTFVRRPRLLAELDREPRHDRHDQQVADHAKPATLAGHDGIGIGSGT